MENQIWDGVWLPLARLAMGLCDQLEFLGDGEHPATLLSIKVHSQPRYDGSVDRAVIIGEVMGRRITITADAEPLPMGRTEGNRAE